MSVFKSAALGFAATGMALTVAPASAHEINVPAGFRAAPAEMAWSHSRDRRYNRGDYYRHSRYDEPIYRDTRTWRGRDGRYYCRKKNGTTGLIIGGAAGALLGREVDTQGDRAVGTILGAAAGALIGKNLDDGRRCR
jgi:uncharacterized protein YcfJ